MSKSEIKGLKQYELLEVIGKGGFGVVHHARDRFGTDVAIKIIPCEKAGTRYQKELDALKKLNRNGEIQKMVKFYDAFQEGESNYIVMEYCKHGNLREYIKKQRGPLDESVGGH